MLTSHDIGATLLNAPVPFHCQPTINSPRNSSYQYNIDGHAINASNNLFIEIIPNRKEHKSLHDNISNYYNSECQYNSYHYLRDDIQRDEAAIDAVEQCRNVEYDISIFTSTVFTEVINTFASQRLVFEKKMNHFYLKMHQI